MQYQVAIKHNDDTLSYLYHRGRTQWTLRTARKHAKECTLKLLAGSWANAKYVAVVAA